MRVPLSWLKDFIALQLDPKDRAGVARLGEVFDSLGLVIESIEHHDEDLDGIVTARVLEIAPIEGADRIRFVRVDAGPSLGELGIVCGAENFAPGDLVALAPVGTTLGSGMTIEARTMRGVQSNGMLCSGQELGLSQDGAGLLILPSGLGEPGALGVPGSSLSAVLAVRPDVVFDIAVEPNRPDCLSIAGIARDLGAALSLGFQLPSAQPQSAPPPATSLASVAVREKTACRQLVGRVLLGLSEFPSTPLVRRRLELAGLRPISAMVDASNYVMLELGQPSHPYDLDQLGGSGITVRFARPGERLVTLDGTEHLLAGSQAGQGEHDGEDLVICDALDEPVGLAGVMGGAASEIHPETSRVLLEVAEFDPLVVGRAAARHGVRTEASTRFWRGIDPLGLDRAADRVCELVQQAAELAGKTLPVLAEGPLEDRPTPFSPRRIGLAVEELNGRLGTELTVGQIVGYLEPIGFSLTEQGSELLVEVPSFRPDCRQAVDVIEEVARHYGYERIVAKQRRSPFVGRLSSHQAERRLVRRALLGYSAEEAWTPSIVDPSAFERAGTSPDGVFLTNPIVAGESMLRSHLLPGLLGSLRHNEGQRNGRLRLFELGVVFLSAETGEERPVEQEQLGVLLALDGDDAGAALRIWEGLCSTLGIKAGSTQLQQDLSLSIAESKEPLALGCHPSRSALIFGVLDGNLRPIGAVGEVDPEVLDAFALERRRLGWLVLDLGALAELPRRSILARPVSKYPPSEIDLSFTLPLELPAAALQAAIANAASELLESVQLLDVYRGNELGPEVRSLTYRLRFRALDHTLSEEELGRLREAVIAEVSAQLPAKLRS